MKRLLVVDDVADNADLLAIFLAKLGYEVFVANDASRAMAIARERQPHAAILDIGLPGMDGYELARTLQESLGQRAPKLIALTGYAKRADRARARDCGFVEHMAKPVDLDRLESMLRWLLR